MPIKSEQSLSMMRLMKHIFLRMMYRTAFMSAKVQEPARSSLEVFQRMQDLQVSDLAQR